MVARRAGARWAGGTLRAMALSELPAATAGVSAGSTLQRASSGDDRRGGSWRHALACMRAWFWLKAVGTTAFMWLFFIGYFHLLRHPARPALEMPVTAIDRWIDFHPWALWPYLSLWVYVAIPAGLLTSFRALLHYGLWIGALCATGLACFYLWPTSVPHVDAADASHAGFSLLRGVDAVGNACPSLHVASATYSMLWLRQLLAELALPRWTRVLNVTWFALIVWSTLAIKQHVWWDLVAGVMLALVFAWPSLRSRVGPRGGDIIAP